MAHDVFICYASADGAAADAVCSAMEKAGIRCWMAPRDVPLGIQYPTAIIEALSQCRLVVLMLSRNAGGSKHVIRELEATINRNLTCIPFRIDAAPLSPQMEYYIRILQWLDASQPPLERHFVSLIQEVRRQLAPLPEPPAPLQRADDAHSEHRIGVAALPPTPPPHFQGRKKELRSLHSYLGNSHLRLISVCGRAGAGKTSLVSQFLCQLLKGRSARLNGERAHLGGVVYVPVKDPGFRSLDKLVDLFSQTLHEKAAADLNARWQQKTSVYEGVEYLFRRFLTGSRYLIVLDNFDILLDANNRIAQEDAAWEQFLETFLLCDHDALLIMTTRGMLHFRPGLESRAETCSEALRVEPGLAADDAVTLLRHLDSSGAKGIRGAPEPILRDIVRHLEGKPKSLETLVGALSPRRTILEACRDKLWLDRLRDDPARELYESLSSEDEKCVLQGLAVYGQKVPIDAVRMVLPDLPVAELLEALLDRFAVAFEQGEYSLHSLDQQYAYQSISENDGCFPRCAGHLRAAKYFEQVCKPRQDWKCFNDLSAHLRRFDHLCRAGAYDEACRLLNEIDRDHLALWGYYPEIIQRRSELIGRIQDRGLAGLNLGNLGAACIDSGDVERSLDYSRQALDIALALGDRFSEGRWTGNIAVIHFARGEVSKARELCERALEIAQTVGDLLHIGRWSGKLGDFCAALGDNQRALGLYRHALDIARQIQDRRFERIWLAVLGDWYVAHGELQEAISAFHEAAEVAVRIGAGKAAIECWVREGNCLGMLPDRARQMRCYAQALDIARQMGFSDIELRIAAEVAAVFQTFGDLQNAVLHCEEALGIARRMERTADELALTNQLAESYQSLGEFQKAIAKYREALEIVCRKKPDRAAERQLWNSLGTAWYCVRDVTQAVQCYQSSLAIARESGDSESQSISLFNIGDAYHLDGKVDAAVSFYNDALSLNSSSTDFKCAYGLGIAFMQKGRAGEARWSFEHCVSLCEGRLTATSGLHPFRSALALSQLAVGNTGAGLATLREALSRSPAKVEIHYARQDAGLLCSACPSIPGLDEAMHMLEAALNVPH